MNKIINRIIFLSMLCVHAYSTADVAPYIAFRSQGFNAARELVGWQTEINKSCMDNLYGSFSVTPEFTRSFNAHKLAECFFSDALIPSSNQNCHNGCEASVIKIQGTKVIDRDPKALMAENFYLPTDFSSEVRFAPRIENFLVDLNLYVGLDNFVEGLYFRMHTPICYTRYNLNFCETITNKGSNNYDVGYFNNSFTPDNFEDPTVYGLSRSYLLSSFQQYACAGDSITGVDGITYNGLEKARMSAQALTKTRLAEITAALGWNFWTGDGYHVGVNLRGAAPTGNAPHGCWLFEPIVGNGHHWELGAGVTAHWRWWENATEDRDFSTYFDANVTTLFASRQERTFDLCGKPLSRYMLALKYTKDVDNLLALDNETLKAPIAQFDNQFIPLANLTTIPVDVSVPLHIDAVLKCSYTHCNWQFDLGYDFWYRSCEKICNRFECCKPGFTDDTYGLKGDAFVYGFPDANPNFARTRNGGGIAVVASQPGIALSASEHKATIVGGTNDYTNNPETWSANNGIDLPHLGFSLVHEDPSYLYTHTIETYADDEQTLALATPVNTSYTQPIYIAACDFNTDGAKTSGLSNKLFTHIGYTWKQCPCLTPYLGIGGEVEFGQNDKTCACSTCNSYAQTSCANSHHSCDSSCCKTCSLSQWGIWIKGGISFN